MKITMYEQFKNELITKLSFHFPAEDVNIIGRCLDLVAADYEITQRETALTIIDDTSELLKTFLVVKKIEGLADSTLEAYKIYIGAFFRDIGKSADEVKPNDLRVFLYRYQEAHGMKASSLDKARQHIQTFFRWASSEGYIESDPTRTVKSIKHEQGSRESLTQIELERIREAAATLREKAIIEFLYSTGCRVSEAVDAKISSIDWSSRSMVVHDIKNRKVKTVYLNAKAELKLREYLMSRSDNDPHLFVSERKPYHNLTTDAILRSVKKMARRAGITKEITPHCFRHTTATIALQNGMPLEEVSKMLGHAKIQTTMIYAKSNQEDLARDHRRFVI